MKSSTPKPLHGFAGKTLLGHVLAALEPLELTRTAVVLGNGTESVADTLVAPITSVLQPSGGYGTGFAVLAALEALDDLPEDSVVLVLAGDTPLLRTRTLESLLASHAAAGAAATVLTAQIPDATGYGRIVRDADGGVIAIVEHKDADEATRAINEINTGTFAFQAGPLRKALALVGTDNASGEYYLTDVVGILRDQRLVVAADIAADAAETEGINDRVQLAAAAAEYNARVVRQAMLDGVTIVDPATTWIDATVTLQPDVTLLPGTRLHGSTTIRSGASVGPDTTLTDCEVGEDAEIRSSTCSGASIGPRATVGPYSYLRPGAILGEDTKVGAFVEIKGSKIGKGSKVPHLSYVGDATIGERTNIGAATVFVNYDGVNKHKAVIGDDVRIGSDTMLVAPVTVGDGAYTAAGSVITTDVPPGSLGVGRARQRNIEGWVERKRGDSHSSGEGHQ